jgi:phage terminase large subunit
MRVQFEVGASHLPIFEQTNWRYAFLMGGRGNGRSGTASRFTIAQLLGKEYTRGAIMRAEREGIRASSWQALNDRLIEAGAESARGLSITHGDMAMQYGQNSIRAFGFKASSGSLSARLKSLEGMNYAWIEEAEDIGENEFTKLDDTFRTTRGRIRIVFTLNTPAKSHWLIKRFFDLDPIPGVPGFYQPKLKREYKDSAIYIPGTYHENLPNLDPVTVQSYERYRETKPEHYWQVIQGYCPETVTDRIYSGWKVVDAVPHEARLLGYGEDFGFDPDPAAIVAVYYYNGGYILDERLYQTELLNEHLTASLKGMAKAPIIADSAEPKSIAEQQQAGLNVIAAEKGPDSVRAGIKHVQGLRISYTRSSLNLHNEYENYAWKLNRDGDQVGIEDPKCANHLMSAARYALTMFAGQGGMYDPEKRERDRIEVSVRRQTLKKNQAR